jgi:predicted nucleic acid-binding protein
MMSVYLDTSVLVALFADDALNDRAQAFLETAPSLLVVSDFAAAELASAVARFVRMREMTRGVALKLFADFDAWIARSVQRIEISAADVTAATGMLRRLDLTLRTPDALHLAIAQRSGAELATVDTRMAAAAQTLGVGLAPA